MINDLGTAVAPQAWAVWCNRFVSVDLLPLKYRAVASAAGPIDYVIIEAKTGTVRSSRKHRAHSALTAPSTGKACTNGHTQGHWKCPGWVGSLRQLSLGSPREAGPYRIGPGQPGHVGDSDGGALTTGHPAGKAGPDGMGEVEDPSGILVRG
jgi:hypothetical protein